ncbi:alpha/beta fold hydrolase [Bacillus weihaiensis]|uniref:Hydroxyalkanoic acid synthase n=1 Tax=Bacillus weihaiensis TaxID=1547283 RepID=A0A1L3MN63_9BACI|nr:alpha/beta fold hydrolase [Bacillus weihaiensis]APH03789.1 hydroxyalkanoic acid synthase [Bacillus weihaiensis]
MNPKTNSSAYNLEQEIKRWKGFFGVWNSPTPKIGVTPREPVWKKNKATLWYYAPSEKKYRVPLFLVYSLVNQPFILDMAPGNSVIENFTRNGFEVYLLDFGIPGYEDKDITAIDYVVDYIQKGVRRAIRHSNAKEITLIGYCLGGTLATMYTTIAEEPIRNLIVNVSPIDFETVPYFKEIAQASKEGLLDVNDLLETTGLVSGRAMKAAMRMVTSPIYFSPYLSLLNKAYDDQYVEKWKRLKKWTDGHIPFTGAAMKELIEELGKGNKLIDGGLKIHGKEAHLSNIHANLLVISNDFDRLVLKEQNIRVIDYVSSKDKTFKLEKGGHTTRANDNHLPPLLANWLPSRSEPIETK